MNDIPSFTKSQLISLGLLVLDFFIALSMLVTNHILPALICFLIHGIGSVVFYYTDVVHTNEALYFQQLALQEKPTILMNTASPSEEASGAEATPSVEQELLTSLQEKCRNQVEEIRQLQEALQRHSDQVSKTEEKLNLMAEKEALESLLPGSPAANPFEPVDIILIAKQVISELSSYAAKGNIQIQISSSAEQILVKADSSRIRIMFRNIIDNSIKYMQKAGSLIITISNIGDDIFIVLKDNGNGLSEMETEHIFELNYQGANRISGNGLGLTQAKAIVSAYGGTIYAKSTLGKGMGIYIQLPTN